MSATAAEPPIRHYRLSRLEYERAVEAGAFEPGARVELIDGDLHAMTPEGSRHSLGIDLAAECLREAFGPGWYVRVQHPLAAGDRSEPEPDIAVVRGPMRSYRDAHPTSAALVVEVSHDSLGRDRSVKQRVYAECGIPEYWILALPDERLEIHRDPAGDGYRTVTKHGRGETVAPLTRPEARIAIDDLLP